LAEIERDSIRASLERNGWVKGISARELGIARSTLFEKMRRYSLRNAAPGA
jgi:transcriptional regulator of acetoin/glycerol metabolism